MVPRQQISHPAGRAGFNKVWLREKSQAKAQGFLVRWSVVQIGVHPERSWTSNQKTHELEHLQNNDRLVVEALGSGLEE
jgi:hypothetical protein